MALSELLGADVVDKLRGGLHTDLALNLLDKSVSIDLACIESLENVIKRPCGSVSEL